VSSKVQKDKKSPLIVPTPRAHGVVRAAWTHLQQLQDELDRGERFDPVASTRPITLAVSDVAERAFFPSIFPALALVNFRQRRLSRHGFACLMRAGHP
jgi:hypothetical protein